MHRVPARPFICSPPAPHVPRRRAKGSVADLSSSLSHFISHFTVSAALLVISHSLFTMPRLQRPKRACASTHAKKEPENAKKSKKMKSKKGPTNKSTKRPHGLPAGQHRDAVSDELCVKIEKDAIFRSPVKASRRSAEEAPPPVDPKVSTLHSRTSLRRLPSSVESLFIDTEARCDAGCASEDEVEEDGGYDNAGQSSEESVSGDGCSQRAFDVRRDSTNADFSSMMAFFDVRMPVYA